MPTRRRQLPASHAVACLPPDRLAIVSRLAETAAQYAFYGDSARYAETIERANAELGKFERGYFQGVVDARMSERP